MMLAQRPEIGGERVVIHPRSAVDHDDRRTFSAVRVPKPNAVAGIDEMLREDNGRGQEQSENDGDSAHRMSMREQQDPCLLFPVTLSLRKSLSNVKTEEDSMA